jgi:hypothetical protein
VTSDPRDLLDRALKALPVPRAPGTLLPRVMAAAEARRRHTGLRPWFTWPIEWRVAAVVASVVVVGAAWLAWPAIAAVGGLVLERAAGALEARAAATVPGSAAAAHLTAVAWEMVIQPALGYLLVWMVVMCAVSVAIGAAFSAALGRVALGEASQ